MSHKIKELDTRLNGIKPSNAFYSKFKNNGSENFKVDGSVTPVTFAIEDLPAGQMLLLQSVSFLLGADDVLDVDKFGDINGLANGILFETKNPGMAIQNNADIFLLSSQQVTSTAGQGSNTFTLIQGRWNFQDSFGGNGLIMMNMDDLKITVRDDLTAMSYFKVSCHGILLEENQDA